MKALSLALAFLGCAAAAAPPPLEKWAEALREMPLPPSTPPLNRDNAMPLLLGAFASNATVKALIFLPAVSDDFYLINRDQPKLNLTASNLLGAILALTNATALRATFHAPFLLLHLDRDFLGPAYPIQHAPMSLPLQQRSHLPHALFSDTHWERIQPALQKALKMEVRPAPHSEDAWHFARHNLAGWNLSDWELLRALSLTGKTQCTVQKERLVFEPRDAP